jgi:hypothetical protein
MRLSGIGGVSSACGGLVRNVGRGSAGRQLRHASRRPGDRARARFDRLAGCRGEQPGERRLRHAQVGLVAVGHDPQERGVRLGRLPLRVLDDTQPRVIDRGHSRDLGKLGLVFEP